MEKPDRPTGAEAAHFAKHTQDLPEWGRLTPAEAADLLESATGRPTDYGTTAEAIGALEQRLTELAAQKKQLLIAITENMASPHPHSRPDQEDALDALNQQLATCTQQLEHYRAQAKQQN